jgi:hypothetical protein
MLELIATEEPLPSATSPKGLLQVSDVWYWARTSCQVEQALRSPIHLETHR